MKRYIIITLLSAAFLNTVQAQKDQDSIIFRSMQDEMVRNMEKLQLPGSPKPYYLSYTTVRKRQFEITGSLGSITSSQCTPWESEGGVQMLTGNNRHNNDVTFNCDIYSEKMPDSVDYNLFRRTFWLNSDLMYKWSLQAATMKEAFRQANPLSEEEAALADRLPVAPVSHMQESPEPYDIDMSSLERMVKEISSIFKEYKDIYNSTVLLNGLDMKVYKSTSEGVRLKQPERYTSLVVAAYVITEDGCRIEDIYTLIADRPAAFPPTAKIMEEVRAFAENLTALRKAPRIREYYEGPVLFEGAAVARIFTDTYLQSGALLAYRKPQTDQLPAIRTMDNRMGKKIVDNRISIMNYSTLEKYGGTRLLGAYRMDADGVRPAERMTLVENGIFRKTLNGRIPTLSSPFSTGSSRFSLSLANGTCLTAPGTVHFKADKGSKAEKIKRSLMKAAREEGLDHAYIVRRIAGPASRIYRLDLKSGKETQVCLGEVSGVVLTGLKRMLDISSKEEVSNYILNGQTLSSIIYPSSILLENIEINEMEIPKEKKQVLTYPLQRRP